MPGRHIVHVRALKVKKRAMDSFQVELQGVVSCPTWTWESSVRAVYILNRWATSPASFSGIQCCVRCVCAYWSGCVYVCPFLNTAFTNQRTSHRDFKHKAIQLEQRCGSSHEDICICVPVYLGVNVCSYVLLYVCVCMCAHTHSRLCQHLPMCIVNLWVCVWIHVCIRICRHAGWWQGDVSFWMKAGRGPDLHPMEFQLRVPTIMLLWRISLQGQAQWLPRGTKEVGQSSVFFGPLHSWAQKPQPLLVLSF